MMRNALLLIAALVLSCACTLDRSKQIKSEYATVIAALQATATPQAPPTPVAPSVLRPATALPTPRPARPTATPTPTVQPLRLVAQGFGAVGRELSYAFIVENPNANQALVNTAYNAVLYNAAGVAVQSDAGIVQLVLPGQRLGQAAMVSLIHDDAIDHVDVALQTGRALPAAQQPAFTADQVAYAPGQALGRVSGIIQNPVPAELHIVLVNAVAYDAAGRIVGGGFTNISLLPASGRARVEVPVLTTSPPDRVELSVELGLGNLDQLSAAATPAPSGDVRIVDQGYGQGYGQEQGTVGYALLIENASSTLEYAGVGYEATFYDAGGVALASESDVLERILPGERIGVAQKRVLAQGGQIARMQARLVPGKPRPAQQGAAFVGGAAAYGPHRGVASVIGTIRNQSTQDVKAVQVFAVAYDARGAISGGGATLIDLAPAGRDAQAEVFITSAGPPARVELFAAPSVRSATN